MASSVFLKVPAAPAGRRPRILFVDNQARDFLQYRTEFARRVREAGFEVHAALPREKGRDEASSEDVSIHTIYLRRKSARLWDELRCCVSLIRLYRRLRPALVHHITLKPTLYGGIAARVAGVPAVVSTLTGLGHLFRSRTVKARILRSVVTRGLRFAFRHPNHFVVFQNPEDRDCLAAESGISPDRAVLVKGSGVDLSSFTPAPEPNGPPLVVMACRLLRDKGIPEFVAAAHELRARGSEARFVLLGAPDRGHPSAVPERTLERWRDAGGVEWAGWQSDMPAFLARSHIVCLPSYYGEGVPRVLLEAAACGRPIVTTDTRGCREVVRQGQNGLLVPPRDAHALAAAIARLAENAPLRCAMGNRGREIAVAEFSAERVIDANLAIYRRLLGSFERRADPILST